MELIHYIISLEEQSQLSCASWHQNFMQADQRVETALAELVHYDMSNEKGFRDEQDLKKKPLGHKLNKTLMTASHLTSH